MDTRTPRAFVPFVVTVVVASFVAAAPPVSAQAPAVAPAPAPAAIVPFPADHPLAKALAKIEASDLRDDVEWLADDERQGRCAGEPQCDEAAEWIADRFADMGLEAIGDDGTFLQKFTFRVRGGGGEQAQTQNVVGFWPGSDPVLRDQLVVLGAHYDHVGTLSSPDAGRDTSGMGDDRIWNGADDNASGTATLIEVAHAFASGGVQCKRSLLFIAFSGEEQGLFGSIWYCRHPLVPIERTLAMINLDMVGRNPTIPVELAAAGSLDGELWNRLVADSHGAAPSLEFAVKPAWLPDSDHASFLDARIPALFLNTGEHEDYHHASDHADKLAYDHMVAIGRFCTALAWNTANSEQKFTFARPTGLGRPQKRLGISSDGALSAERRAELALPKEQGGFEVKELDPEGVGAKAGLLEGDVIVAIDGKPLDADDPFTSLRRLIGGAARGQDVPLVVRRGADAVTLNARWE